MTYFTNSGYCHTCSSDVTFTATGSWFRDLYLCDKCGSLPRERALMRVIETFYPAWQALTVHETSPATRGASARIAKEAANYIPSQYFPDTPGGSFKWGYRSENIEKLTFPDESIDLHISQDVMEHIFNPEQAFKEIARTLRPGGAHIFTVPIVNKGGRTSRRATLDAQANVMHLKEAQYHGNPVDETGALVTFDWGYDICEKIHAASGMFTHIIQIDDLSHGIRAEYIDVLVSVKQG
jgi:SAM-dependent methyltransferase